MVYGYQLGLDDGPEFLTFAKVIQNPLLYKNDLFMKSMLSIPWNERTTFGIFFSLFQNIEWAGFIVHVLLTFFLVLGVLKLSQIILNDFFWATLVTIFYFFLTLKIEIGGTSLHLHNIQGESFANTFIVWALVALVKKKEMLAYAMIVLATYFHVLIGFQSFIFISGAYVLHMIFYKDYNNIKIIIYSLLAYTLICGWMIVLVFSGNNSGSIITNEQFMDMTYHFSLKCHFDPQSFSRKGLLLFLISLASGLYFYKKQQPLFYFILITLFIGYIVYLIGYYFNSYLITTSWWFRTNMWLMLLGQIAGVGLIKQYDFFNKYKRILIAIILFLAIGKALLSRNSVSYMYPWKQLSEDNDEIKTALACKRVSNIDDVFIHPLTFTALKYFGERASYVEYNRILRSRNDVKHWYNRLWEVYKLDNSIETARNSEFEKSINENYYNLDDSELNLLASKGVKYIISLAGHSSRFPTIYSNKTYKIIRIKI
ncbi:MAG: hypothetical protein EAZ07_05155 [Cytophagales bacterium]|nr:MAG: hypothetical protein EAZ07_05155 [Cytophagales bacterium]